MPAIQRVGLLTWPATSLPFASPEYVLDGLTAWWSEEAVLRSVVTSTTLVAELDGVVVGTATVGTLEGSPVL